MCSGIHGDEATARKKSGQGDETFLVRVKHLLSIFATCTLRGPDFGAQYNDVAQASHIAVRVRTQYLQVNLSKEAEPIARPGRPAYIAHVLRA